MAKEKSAFFTYKGLPLVRKGNQLYFGNMYDKFVVQMEITSTKKVGELEIADKVMIRKISTDMTISPLEAIVKTAKKDSLYEALDIACAWLKVS